MVSQFKLCKLLGAALLAVVYSGRGVLGQQGQSLKPYCTEKADCKFLLRNGDNNREGVFVQCVEVTEDGATKKVCAIHFVTDTELGYAQTANDPIACNCVPRDSDNPPRARMACEKVVAINNGVLSYEINNVKRYYKLSSPKPGTTDISYLCTNEETGMKYVTCPVNEKYYKSSNN